MKRMLFAAIFALALLGAQNANAGNHFVFELDAGFNSPYSIHNTEGGMGGAYGLTLGYGGRFGNGPALYFVGRFGYSDLDYRGLNASGGLHVTRQALDFGFGGRLYLPITERLRFLLQLTLGGTFDESEVEQRGLTSLIIKENAFTLGVDAGLQYRINNNFSFGFTVANDLYPGSTAFREAPFKVGATEGLDGQVSCSFTATFHF